jgi:hypothetical protein
MLIGEKPITGWSAAEAALAPTVAVVAASARAPAAATTRVMCFTNTPYFVALNRFKLLCLGSVTIESGYKAKVAISRET